MVANNENFDAWELRAIDRFATKAHVKDVEGKVDAVVTTVSEQGKLLARLDFTMEAIRSILTRIAWLLATPIISALGFGFIYLIYQVVNSGNF